MDASSWWHDRETQKGQSKNKEREGERRGAIHEEETAMRRLGVATQ